MKKILIIISILFLISSCKTKQVKVVEEEFICNNKSFEYLECIEQQVQYSVNRNEQPTNQGMNYILHSCCEYVNALDRAKKYVSASTPQSDLANIENMK